MIELGESTIQDIIDFTLSDAGDSHVVVGPSRAGGKLGPGRAAMATTPVAVANMGATITQPKHV